MAGIDPRLVSILVTAVILSTLIVLTIFEFEETEDILLLRNQYPEIFVKKSAQKGVDTSFSFAVISGRKLGEMELRFASLYEKEPGYDWSELTSEPTADVVDFAEHIKTIEVMRERTESLGGSPEIIVRSLVINETRYDAVLYDFSRFLGLFCNSVQELSEWPSLFLVLKANRTVRYFEGRTGFFLGAPQTLDYLLISKDGNRSEYIGFDLESAPIGILRYEDLEKDQKISVIFEVQVEVEELPEIPLGATERLVIQVVEGYADGNLTLLQVKGIPIGR